MKDWLIMWLKRLGAWLLTFQTAEDHRLQEQPETPYRTNCPACGAAITPEDARCPECEIVLR